jgi:hypothetical protein
MEQKEEVSNFSTINNDFKEPIFTKSYLLSEAATVGRKKLQGVHH